MIFYHIKTYHTIIKFKNFSQEKLRKRGKESSNSMNKDYFKKIMEIMNFLTY
jgi:hypothetical protein